MQEDMETAVMNLHSVFESLRAQADVLNESIEPRKYWLCWIIEIKCMHAVVHCLNLSH